MDGIAYVYDKEFLRRNLSIPFVSAQYGLGFDEYNRTLCPFHEDNSHPNLELQPPGDDGVPWWFCRACGASGDVLGLLAKLAEVPFAKAIGIGSKLYPDQPDDVPRGPTKQSIKYVPDTSWLVRLGELKERTYLTVHAGLLGYAYGFDEYGPEMDEHLLSWGWVLDESANILIPHFDRNRELTCVKVRTTGQHRGWAAYGKYTDLYGSWRGKEKDYLLICEGESDCVWADWLAKKEGLPIQTLALPTGAGATQDDWVGYVRERWHPSTVCLGFDNDVAGTEATKRWVTFFPGCKELQLPQGADVRSSGSSLSQLFSHSTRR